VHHSPNPLRTVAYIGRNIVMRVNCRQSTRQSVN
jgi:hypothetical protein